MFQKLTKFPIYSMINLTSRVYWPFEGMRSKLMMSSKQTDHLFHMVLVIDACFLIYNLSWNSKKRQQNQTLYYYIYTKKCCVMSLNDEHPVFQVPPWHSGTFARFHDERHTWPWWMVDTPLIHPKKKGRYRGRFVALLHVLIHTYKVCIYIYHMIYR